MTKYIILTAGDSGGFSYNCATYTKASPIQSKKDNCIGDFAKLFIAKTGAPKRLRFGQTVFKFVRSFGTCRKTREIIGI